MLLSPSRFAALVGVFLLTGAAAQPGGVSPTVHAIAKGTAPSPTLRIVPTPVKQGDEVQLLDLRMWRFDIAAPKPAHRVTFIVEAREPGKPPRRLVSKFVEPGIGWPQTNHLSVFVGSYPLSDGLRESAKAKYMVRVEGFHVSPLRSFGANTASAVLDNPFSGLAMVDTFSRPEREQDNSFVLISGSRQNIPTAKPSADVRLIFRAQEEAY